MPAEPNEPQSGAPRSVANLLVKNTLYLTVAQALTVPMAMLNNAVMARYLSAEIFGYLYLASTLSSFAFLLINFGHEGSLPAAVAVDREKAGLYLGSSLASRAALIPPIYGVVAGSCYFLGYDPQLQWAFALTFLGAMFVSVVAACKDTIRGFERTDIPAYTHVFSQFLLVAATIAVLVLGGGMKLTLLTQAATTAVMVVYIWMNLRPVGVGRVAVSRDAVRSLMRTGAPFVFFGITMQLQPSIDAMFLSKMAPAEIVGSYAVARRLIGVLMFPAASLIDALYPTLCRLWSTDKDAFAESAGASLRAVAVLVAPMAIGCGLFPEIGVAIFGRQSFEPAEDDLRVLSLFVFLVYFSMPLGTLILAAEKRRAWTVVQSLCVVVSLVLDPILLPLFQSRYGNGALGLCVASVVSELAVILCGFWLAPRGVLDRRLAKSLALSAVAGAGMVAVALAAKPFVPVVVAAVFAVLAYFLVLRATGGLGDEFIAPVRRLLAGKFARFKRA